MKSLQLAACVNIGLGCGSAVSPLAEVARAGSSKEISPHAVGTSSVIAISIGKQNCLIDIKETP